MSHRDKPYYTISSIIIKGRPPMTEAVADYVLLGCVRVFVCLSVCLRSICVYDFIFTPICHGFVVRHVVQQAVQQIHKLYTNSAKNRKPATNPQHLDMSRKYHMISKDLL